MMAVGRDAAGRRRRRIRLGVIAAVLAAVVLIAVSLLDGTSLSDAEPPVVPAPITPLAGGEPAAVTIPEGFLPSEAVAAKPLSQPGVRWVRTDEVNLPPLVSPCGGNLPSEAERVGGRQLALLGPTGWKVARLVVYRDVVAARQAMAERRAALQECRRHDEGGGTVTVWISQSFPIGEEAMFVGSQRYWVIVAVRGGMRSLLMRQGRAVMMYVDFGMVTTPSKAADVAWYRDAARDMAVKLAAAPWAQDPG